MNCGVKNYLEEDHRSYIRNLCSCKKKSLKKKNSGLHGVRTLDLCDTGAALAIMGLKQGRGIGEWEWGTENGERRTENLKTGNL